MGTEANIFKVDLVVAIPPVSAIPTMRAAFCLPLIVWKWARPVVPPAPGLKSVVCEVKRPSVIRVLAIASVVAEYPPVPAGTVQSIVVSGFKSG